MLEAARRWLTLGPPAFTVRPILLSVEPLLSRPPYAGPVPHRVKQRIIRDHARRFQLRTLVETGTYMGDMVGAMQGHFDNIHSIELDPQLHARVSKRFNGNARVHLYQGDSATVLGQVISRLQGPSLFWLDGHYSAGITAKGERETPVLAEIGHVLGDTRWPHVILIDDARCFGLGDYPSIAELQKVISSRPGMWTEIADDVIRITPASASTPTPAEATIASS